MSELEKIVDIANPQHPHVALVLVLDTSGSMDGMKIETLNDALPVLKEEIRKDNLAAKRVDLAIVTFGSTVDVVHDFSTVDSFTPPRLVASGGTPMGAAILKGIDLIEERKRHYKDRGVDYYRPWIFLITDGEAGDMSPGQSLWTEVANKVRDGDSERNKKFLFFAVGVESANIEWLAQIAPSNRPPIRLQGLAFKELFIWLSKSQSKVSGSKVGEQVELPTVTGWAKI